jgi:hypothetical protein
MTADSGESVVTITLHDWYAGQALSGILGNNELLQPLIDEAEGFEKVIEFSFIIADKMVKRRSKCKKTGFYPPAAS